MSKTPETFGGLTREQIRWDAEHQPDHLTNCAAAMVALLDALERSERERDAHKEDAERYRWLRSRTGSRELNDLETPETPEDCDRILDAARRKDFKTAAPDRE